MQRYGIVEVYKKNWSWSKDLERWFRHLSKKRYSLNFPCGLSQFGDIRADIDPKVKPDIICDLYNPPFRKGSFTFVLIDPPFRCYNRFKWLADLVNLSTDLVLISTPGIVPFIKGFKKELYSTLERGKFFVRHFVLYKKKNKTLEF